MDDYEVMRQKKLEQKQVITDNTETLNNALARIKDLESQLQIVEKMKDNTALDFFEWLRKKYKGTQRLSDSFFTVLEAYLKEKPNNDTKF